MTTITSDSPQNINSGNIVIQVPPANLKLQITPYGMALMSDDLYQSSEGHRPSRFPLVNYFLYCSSVELGLKAAILYVDCSEERLLELIKIRHNLTKLLNMYKKIVSTDFFESHEELVLRKMNKFYKDKGLEYFTSVVIGEALMGYSNMPSIEGLKSVGTKVNAYVKDEGYFIDATEK